MGSSPLRASVFRYSQVCVSIFSWLRTVAVGMVAVSMVILIWPTVRGWSVSVSVAS